MRLMGLHKVDRIFPLDVVVPIVVKCEYRFVFLGYCLLRRVDGFQGLTKDFDSL